VQPNNLAVKVVYGVGGTGVPTVGGVLVLFPEPAAMRHIWYFASSCWTAASAA
jgi:hypothetical protein